MSNPNLRNMDLPCVLDLTARRHTSGGFGEAACNPWSVPEGAPKGDPFLPLSLCPPPPR